MISFNENNWSQKNEEFKNKDSSDQAQKVNNFLDGYYLFLPGYME